MQDFGPFHPYYRYLGLSSQDVRPALSKPTETLQPTPSIRGPDLQRQERYYAHPPKLLRSPTYCGTGHIVIGNVTSVN